MVQLVEFQLPSWSAQSYDTKQRIAIETPLNNWNHMIFMKRPGINASPCPEINAWIRWFLTFLVKPFFVIFNWVFQVQLLIGIVLKFDGTDLRICYAHFNECMTKWFHHMSPSKLIATEQFWTNFLTGECRRQSDANHSRPIGYDIWPENSIFDRFANDCSHSSIISLLRKEESAIMSPYQCVLTRNDSQWWQGKLCSN